MNCACCEVKYKQCCELLERLISDIASPVGYNPIRRSYFVDRTLKGGSGHSIINYCPYCGKKLPEYLGDLWYEILDKEYAIDPYDATLDNPKVPQEFKTDEWWKKRGL